MSRAKLRYIIFFFRKHLAQYLVQAKNVDLQFFNSISYKVKMTAQYTGVSRMC